MAANVLLRRALINTAIALIPPVLMLSLYQGVTPRQLWLSFLYSLVYSHLIGSLAFTAIPRVWCAAPTSAVWVQWLLRTAAVFAIALTGSMLAAFVVVLLRGLPLANYWAELGGSLKIAVLITAGASAVVSMYESFRSRLDQTTLELRNKELERERALKLATEAQLASLESRIHPHFLFNALNSISSLIPEDPQRAERLIEQMAALLRFSLESSHAGLVPLASEVKIVSDYLEIEKARFGDRLRYEIELAADLNGARVPPLSVQTLVENSVKYAVAPNRGGGEIGVRGNRINDLLQLEISDTGPRFDLESAPAGHGLDTLRRRLQTLFGAKANLKLERSGGRNHLILSIPHTSDEHAGIPG